MHPIIIIVLTVVVTLIVLHIIATHFAVKCPKCGAYMVWNDSGYDKWDCRGCGHSER